MPGFNPLYTPFAAGILVPLILIAALWTIILKGFALWHAARGGQRGWFISMLVINTLGILEIIYLIWFRPGPTKPEEAPKHVSSSAQ